MDLAGWDQRYRAELVAPTARDSVPSPLLVATAEGMQPGRALDLACGSGRHALWLAQHGWQVTAVDGSAAAIAMLTASAAQPGVHVDARVADLEKGQFAIEPARWELIASCYYLQRDLLEPIRQGLVPGGIAIVIALLAEPGREPSPFRVQPGELRSYFNGWEILHDREGPDASGHVVAEIAARKPSLRTTPPAR
jgi:tellurite methyltransferase